MAQYEAFEFPGLNYFSKINGWFYLDLKGKPSSISGISDDFSLIENMGPDTEEPGTIGFYYPSYTAYSVSVVLKSQRLPLMRNYDLRQKIFESPGGNVYSYTEATENKQIELKIMGLSKQKLKRLLTFFIKIVKGVKEEFDFRDEGGNIYRVRFMEDELLYRQTAYDKWEVKIRLRRV